MASVIDSFREVFSDKFSFLKITILAIPVYYSYLLYTQPGQNPTFFALIAGLTAFFLFGFLVEVSVNVVNDDFKLIPSLNPIKLSMSAMKGILSIGPITFVLYTIANFICTRINVIAWFDSAVEGIIWAIVLSNIITAYLMFISEEKIIDAFNIKLIFEKSGDFVVIVALYVIQLAAINLVTTGFIAYTLNLLFGAGPILNFFLAIALVFNAGAMGHYLGQLHCETIGYDKPEKDSDKKQK